MKRDMMKIAGKGWKNIPPKYQPGCEDLITLKEMIYQDEQPSEKMYCCFGILFRYGFELGRRYEKRHGAQAGKKA